MKVVLTGAEKGTYLKTLRECEVPNVALNLTQFAIPKTKELDLKERIGEANIYVYTSDTDEDVEKFDSFLREHADSITCVIGRPDYNGDWLDDKYVPLWNDEKDVERLAYLCQRYGRVAISDRAINKDTAVRIRQLQKRWGATLIGITSKLDWIESIPWDVVIVSSWTSVVRRGETQVWDGHKMWRHAAQKKESSRKRHRGDIMRLGIDFDAVMEDDVHEVAKLAVKSWMAWAESTHGQATPSAYRPFDDPEEDTSEGAYEGGIVAIPGETHDVANTDSEGGGIATDAPERRHESERILLPVMALEGVVSEDEDTGIPGNSAPTIHLSNTNVRHCDSCYLASKCYAFKEHAECAFSLPVEIRTKKQLEAATQAIIEMQMSRVLFAKFAEELEGAGIDPALSAEMDRLMRLIAAKKDIEDTRDVFKMEVQARGSGQGVLSRIFGSKAEEHFSQVQTPMTAGELDAAIIDAEVLTDTEIPDRVFAHDEPSTR